MRVPGGATADQRRRRRAAFSRRVTPQWGQCWGCGIVGKLIRHHVIQLQNGGTNWHENIELVCEVCHDEVHRCLKARQLDSEMNAADARALSSSATKCGTVADARLVR